MSEEFFSLPSVYPWHEQVWKNLTPRFPNIGHGLLFYGKQGCGKQDFTAHFVAWILCLNKQEQAACGACTSCLWLKSDTHPNYLKIGLDDDGKKISTQIKIDKIRELVPFIQQTVEGWRVVVIEPAHALNTAAANALLKTLEEPGERTLLILVTEHILKLPATVRSRLQRYALDRITLKQAQDYLQVNQSVEKNTAELALNLANLMPLHALTLLKNSWLDKRQEFLDDWLDLVIQKNMLMRYSMKWAKQIPFVEFEQMLEYLLSDLVCVKLKQPIKNIDLNLLPLAEQYDLETLFQLYAQLQQCKRLAEQNVQTNLMIDQVFTLLINV